MPKTKKQQRKTEDFKKVKLKVGKKKAPPSNATDTSFTSKSIVLSSQSITADKGAALTNSRNLTLKDVLGKMRHYSAPVRKDALVGLADLVSMHGHVLQTELGPIIESSVRLIVDAEPAVRRSLLRFYGDVLRDVPARDLAPFASLMVVFTCSGMTHILEDIRSDAIKFLDLLVDVAPTAVAQHSATIMRNFFSLLETKTATKAADAGRQSESVNTRTSLLTQGSRLSIMQSCYKYMSAHARPLLESDDDLWFMYADRAIGNAKAQTVSDIDSCFYPDSPAPFANLGLFGEATAAASAAVDTIASLRAQSKESFERLFPFLQETWMESVTIFGTNNIGSDKSLELCALVLQILQTLWRTAYVENVPSSARDLIGFLRRCMVYFPFGRQYVGDAQVEETLLAMNIKVCELVALVNLGAAESEELAAESQGWTQRATRFVLQAMGLKPSGSSSANKAEQGKPGQQASQRLQASVANVHLRPELFEHLLLALWRLAQGSRHKDTELLIAGAVHYARSCALVSTSKTLCIRFLTRAIEIHWSRNSSLRLLDLAPLHSIFAEWVLSLPKLMWQLRDRNQPASAAAAYALRLVCQRTHLLDDSAVATLQASLVPLFCVAVPSKGVVYGPFRTYPLSLQKAVLEVVGCCSQCPSNLVQAIRDCVASDSSVPDQIQVLVQETVTC
ncbi:rRNA processing protein [Coemansia sp. IMI 203386]|nr:rRNA processing protein [Coemansia sp. IMI 203386]